MLRIRCLSKRFGTFDALRSIDITVEPGEIHGLVGMNGSGKTTLLNILFGNPVIASTGGFKGEVLLRGSQADISTPQRAIAQGIGMVHQEFALIPSMSVAENITILREKVINVTRILGSNLAFLDREANIKKATHVLGRLGIGLDPKILMLNLTMNMKQFVEIAREIDRNDLKVLLLDEPTSALHQADSKRFFTVLRELSAKGVAIIFVSHRLEEIMSVCHRVTVLRDGEVAGRFNGPEYDIDAISRSMIGHTVTKARKLEASANGREVIRLEEFSVNMPGERLKSMNLGIRRGEILGLAGLSGQGRPALGYGIMGMYETGGKMFVHDEHIAKPNPTAMISRGVFLLPEDRRAVGLLADHSVMENIAFTAMQSRGDFLHRFPIGPLSFMHRKKVRTYARQCIERFDIRCRGVHQLLSELSGGNQQKVCIARSLAIDPEILFVSEPTRGVDIAAKETILNIFLDLNRDSGTTLVISSSELDELMRICDRIAVIYEGEVFDILEPDCSEKEFALAFSGERRIHS